MSERESEDQVGSQIHSFVGDLVVAMMEPKQVHATYRVPKDLAAFDTPFSITDCLDLDPSDMSPLAAHALEAIEAPGGDHHGAWTDLKWKLTAFTYIQDIFDAVLRDGDDARALFRQYYFYFESQRLLSESILCGLNGFYAAAQALLRPFLEFSLLQNYYHRALRESHSYGVLEQYFEKGTRPASATVLKNAMPRDEFTRPIRFRLQQHVSALSESTLHPYHPNHSVQQHSTSIGQHSFEGLHFWFMTRLILEAALWVYYVNFPLLFHPVNILRKFGFNGPVGVFIDEAGGRAVERSLPSEDYARFNAYARSNSVAQEQMVWFGKRADLSDDQIQAMWDKDEYGEYPGLWAGYCQQMSLERAMRRLLAVPQSTLDTPLPDEQLRQFDTLKGWREFSARRRAED